MIYAEENERQVLPNAGKFEASEYGGAVTYAYDIEDGSMELRIKGQFFTMADLKELRKFIKVLERDFT